MSDAVRLCIKCYKPLALTSSFGAIICQCDYIGLVDVNKLPGGTKHDTGKPPLSLVPRAAIEQVAQVFAFGARKYTRDNYKKGFDYTRLTDAALRHIVAAVDGEDKDQESSLAHIAHSICCLAMLLECQRLGTLKDDRYKKE